MCSKQNRRFKFECFQNDNSNKRVENIDTYICNLNQKWNYDKCGCECKNAEKYNAWE